jgi:LPXTG-motif cell wall-anchored protein
MGIAFISLGISGQRAFIAIGGAFLALGAALLFRQRRNHEQ